MTFHIVKLPTNIHYTDCIRRISHKMAENKTNVAVNNELSFYKHEIFYPQTANDDGRSIRALSGACLLSLAVAYGDTGKLLSAASAMLMSPRGFELIVMPSILASLQRSVISVMLGQTDHPGND